MSIIYIVKDKDGTSRTLEHAEWYEEIGQYFTTAKSKKVGYTVGELIEKLKTYDPSTQVSIGKTGIYDVDSLPYYYDGRLRLAVYNDVEVSHPDEHHNYSYRELIGSEQATGGNHVFFEYSGGRYEDVFIDTASEGQLFEYSFKNVRDPVKSMETVFNDIQEGLKFQLANHGGVYMSQEYIDKQEGKTVDDFRMDTIRGLKTRDGQVVISKEEMTSEYIDNLTPELFWQLVRERTSLDLFG